VKGKEIKSKPPAPTGRNNIAQGSALGAKVKRKEIKSLDEIQI